ncbi:MAG: hypothetical protein FE834_06035, partial [Gammaproteobacteria bacterium]|nr:hypothetical protein [Gammaproteobacteria bacterium]
YTPKGNIRLSFVDHGSNLSADGEIGIEKLTNKVQQIHDTYTNSNDGTYLERIALVGCDTDGIKQDLTRKFAQSVYARIPALQDATITGRKGEVQVNDNGTKTMQTNGKKTIYSWNDGKLVVETKKAKTTADKLEHSLNLLNDQKQIVEDLIVNRRGAKNEHFGILRHIRTVFEGVDRDGFEPHLFTLEERARDLRIHLAENPKSKILNELNALLKFIDGQTKDIKLEITRRLNAFTSDLERKLVALKGKKTTTFLDVVKAFKELQKYTGSNFQSQDNPKIAALKKTLLNVLNDMGRAELGRINKTLAEQQQFTVDEKIKTLTKLKKRMYHLEAYSAFFKEYLNANIKTWYSEFHTYFNKIKLQQIEEQKKYSILELEKRFLDIANKGLGTLPEITLFYDALLVWIEHNDEHKNDSKILRFQEKSLRGLNQIGEQSLTQLDKDFSKQKQPGLPTNERDNLLMGIDADLNALTTNSRHFSSSLQSQIENWKSNFQIYKSKLRLTTWKVVEVKPTYETLFVGFDHVIVVQLEDNDGIAKGAAGAAGKHFNQSTLLQVDAQGGSRVVHGMPLKEIKGRVKIVFYGHGNRASKASEFSETIAYRTPADIVEHITNLKKELVLVKNKSIKRVSIKGCRLGSDFGKDIAIKLNDKGIPASVSTRLGATRLITSGGNGNGRRTIDKFYHSNSKKVIWAYDSSGNLFKAKESYTDTNYHAVLSIGKKGAPNLEKTYKDMPLATFNDGLKILVKAGKPEETLKMLSIFEERLQNRGEPPMEQINIKMGKNAVDWIGNPPNMRAYGELITRFSEKTNADIVASSDSGPHEGTAVFKYRATPKEVWVTTPKYDVIFKKQAENIITLNHIKNHTLFDLPTTPKVNAKWTLFVSIGENNYDKGKILSQLDNIKEMIGKHTINKVEIVVKTTQVPTKDHAELAGYVSKKLNTEVTLLCDVVGKTEFETILSRKPSDPDVKALNFHHLAETTPYQDKNLQDWSPLSDDQHQKLKTESTKTKPSLANHDHQIILQTEDDKNVRQSTLDLASKHPTQTTIIQIDKNGTHQVVYGPKLKDIQGQVKIVTVGYGREKDGTHTLGGRTPDELSQNLIKLNQDLNPNNATIKHLSVVGCNLDTDNPTDNHNSNYGAKLLTNLNQANIPLSVSTRSAYVAVDEYGRKLTSDTGQGDWKHKESQSKTVYSIDDAGNVVTQFYDSTGTPTENLSRYKTNIILELPSDDTVKNAAQALANKHPENSYIAKIDANGIIRVYNLNGNEVNLGVKGRYRINVVGHGSKMRTLGAQTLTQHIKNLQTQLKIDPKEEGRIGLVGCETSIKPSANVTSLTETVARNLYSDGMTNLQITGRTAEIEVNDNGTKTMLTGGKKTVYSWDGKQGVIESTEEVKQTADKLNNPLDDFYEQISIIKQLMEKKGSQSKSYPILLNTMHAFFNVKEMNFQDSLSNLERVELTLQKHLTGLKSEIKRQLSALLEFTGTQIIKARSEIVEQNIQIAELERKFLGIMNNHKTFSIRLQETSVLYEALLEHEEQGTKYKNNQDIKELYNKALRELNKAGESLLAETLTLSNSKQGLDADLEIQQLEQAQKNVNELDSYLKYYQDNQNNLTQKITQLQLQIPLKLAQAKLKKWKQFQVNDTYKTVLLGFEHVVIMQLEDDSTIAQSAAEGAGKYFGESTLVRVDKEGNSLVVYGTPLEQIEGKVKIVVYGHGSKINQTIAGRKVSIVVDHIVDLKKKLALVKKKSVKEVSIKGCNLGSDFGKEVAIGLNKEGIQASVSSRLAPTRGLVDGSGRRTIGNFYHSNEKKSVWSWDDQGNIFKEKVAYPNTNYHAILSIDAKGLPDLEKTYENKDLSTFKDGLKVFVKAGKSEETLQMLLTFEKYLQGIGAPPMKQINIKMGKNEVDWIGNPVDMFSYGKHIVELSERTNAHVISSSDSGPHEGTVVSRHTTKPENLLIATPKYSIFYGNRLDDTISLEHTNDSILFVLPKISKAHTSSVLRIEISEKSYFTKKLLSELDTLKGITGGHSFSEVHVLMKVDQNHPIINAHDKLTGYLSKKLNMNVGLFYNPLNATSYTQVSSKTPTDSDVMNLDLSHLAETTPHQDKNLQDWTP